MTSHHWNSMKLALLFYAIALPVEADDTRHIWAVDQVGRIFAVSKLCPEAKIDDAKAEIAAGMLGVAFPYDNERVKQAFDQQTARILANLDIINACQVAELLYGANGIEIQNLLVPK